MYICDSSIDSVSFYDWSIILWNCSHSVRFFFPFFHFETDHFEADHFKVDYSLNWSDQRNVTSISNEIGIITQRERTKTVSIQYIMYIWQLIWLFEIHIMQTVHWYWGSYGSLWTGLSSPKYYKIRSEAEGHIIFWGDRPVHKLPFGQKCQELFVISYTQLTKTTPIRTQLDALYGHF